MSTITREFTKEQVVGHIRAKLDAHQNSTWPVSMASSAQMEKQILESALAALTAPPAPVSVTDRSMFEKWWESEHGSPLDSWDSLRTTDGYCDDGIDGQFEAWSACRAAMLQGADGNSPVIPDGWVDCSERMPDNRGKSRELYVCWGTYFDGAEPDYIPALFFFTQLMDGVNGNH